MAASCTEKEVKEKYPEYRIYLLIIKLHYTKCTITKPSLLVKKFIINYINVSIDKYSRKINIASKEILDRFVFFQCAKKVR